MPVPQWKAGAPGARPITDEVECEPHAPVPVSVDGVLGCDDVVGDIELPAMEFLRGRLSVCDVSFNHEERRTGFWGATTVCAES